MQMHELFAHPAHPPLAVRSITAKIDASHQHWLRLRWRIEGAGRLMVPPPAGSKRADDLWKTTCFELFASGAEDRGYREFNFSPSEHWAAYDFASHRKRGGDPEMPRQPVIAFRGTQDLAIVDVELPRLALPRLPCSYGISAVIEEEGGTKSFWALAHPPKGPPDFHAAACFAGRLEAPSGA